MSVKTESGGMFNSYKTKYSPETHKLLKVLMDEAKLTISQRHQMKESLEKGKPLPAVTKKCHRPNYCDENLFGMKRNFYFMRRGRDQIINSGAYERDRYHILERTVDHEKEKEKLQNIMVYGKAGKGEDQIDGNRRKLGKRQAKEVPKGPTREERVDELINEIEERLEFLNEMDTMGKRKDYQVIMQQEIAAKLREMEKLDVNSAKKYAKCLESVSGKMHGTKPF